MNTEAAISIAQGLDDERPSIGQALCTIDEKLSGAKFNWITGQAARDALEAEFNVSSGADKAKAIYAAKGWERKVRLYKLAYPKSSFKRFWDQFGNIDADDKGAAQATWRVQR